MSHFGISSMSNLLWISTWRCGEVPVTFYALEGFLCMEPLMVLHVSWSWKAVATLCAIRWILSSVSHFMNLYLIWKRSCNIWYNSMVSIFTDPLIVHQVISFWEALTTLWSIGWLLPKFWAKSRTNSGSVCSVSERIAFQYNTGKAPVAFWCTSMVVSFMDPLMVLHVSWSWEALATFIHLNGFSPVWFLSWFVTWCWKAPETSMFSFLHGSSDGTLSILILRSSCHT